MAEQKNLLPFQLRGHDVFPDEHDVYGTQHHLHFKAGSPENIASYRFGGVDFRVDGLALNQNGQHIITDFAARIDFPPDDEARLSGRYATLLTPEFEELEVLAEGLMLVLSHPNIELRTTLSRFALDIEPTLETDDDLYSAPLHIESTRQTNTIDSSLLN
jgi:hypothetical protein